MSTYLQIKGGLVVVRSVVLRVSLPGTATYKLAKDLWRRLKHLISGSEHTIKNAGQFLRKLRSFSIEDYEVMLSPDVTSHFTSINHNLARVTIAELLRNNSNTTEAMKREIYANCWTSARIHTLASMDKHINS
ncbi:hypothetical protein T265_01395 [Opisthorchis viverrini]|uniref:Uncharacterized protein n=1 Tax=Opisthorchis viverrini TaxID=6198 RepID=A0A075A2P0_OPIVI|nr:hypothetical protein T265_01395 [Opisthorchis viverrini]KER32517.1 hypothetical protein T265_01395 [Opisthorchis viverrini]